MYLPVLFHLVAFLLPLVHSRATVHLAQMTPKPHHLQHHLRHPAFSVVTMTPFLNRPSRSAPHRLVLHLPMAIHSFPLHQLHLALVAQLDPLFLLINRGMIAAVGLIPWWRGLLPAAARSSRCCGSWRTAPGRTSCSWSRRRGWTGCCTRPCASLLPAGRRPRCPVQLQLIHSRLGRWIYLTERPDSSLDQWWIYGNFLFQITLINRGAFFYFLHQVF